MTWRPRPLAGDYERDARSGLLLPRHARRGVERVAPQFMCGPGFFGGGSPYRTHMRFDTGNNSTVFTDEGAAPQTWTRSGTGVYCSTGQILAGVSSLYCTANTDYLEAPNNSDNALTSGDLTINIRVRWGATPTSIYAASVQNATGTAAGTAWAIATNSNQRLIIALSDGSTRSVYTAAANGMVANTNYQLRFVRSGSGSNNCHGYIDSTEVLTFTDTKTLAIPSGEVIRIGKAKAANTIADSYFDDFWTARQAIFP